MSSRKSQRLTLSPKAHQDFIDILRYTGKTWGEKQLLAYRDKINQALQAIGNNPQLGHQPRTHSINRGLCKRAIWDGAQGVSRRTGWSPVQAAQRRTPPK